MSENRGPNGSAVSVIGLGQMGARLAEAFLAAGHATTVWNRTAAKADALVGQGADRAATVDAAVTASPLIVVCLPDYPAVADVLDPAAENLRGRTVANVSSGTPQDAVQLAEWAASQGAGYLDGAAMSGTRLVGRPEAMFIFSGSGESFTTHRAALASLGNAMYLGADPALAPVYDTALFGLAWGALAGFYHAVALAGAAGADPSTFAGVATEHMPFVTSLMADHARQLVDGSFPNDDGAVGVHAAAMEHLVHVSRAQGLVTDIPDLFKTLLERAAADGHGSSGIASVIETIRNGRKDV